MLLRRFFDIYLNLGLNIPEFELLVLSVFMSPVCLFLSSLYFYFLILLYNQRLKRLLYGYRYLGGVRYLRVLGPASGGGQGGRRQEHHRVGRLRLWQVPYTFL
jgi:hypothetical protein